MIINFIIGAIIVTVVGFALYGARKKRISDKADRILKDLNAVWASQGPFKNGEESARAMKIATIAVRGDESINAPVTAEYLAKHPSSYNANPHTWESLRQDYLVYAHGKMFEEYFAKAVKLGAAQPRKKKSRK